MMSVCSSTTQANPVEADLINADLESAQQEEASSTNTVISTASDQQLAIVRSLSESCLSLLNQSGSTFTHHMENTSPKPTEVLTAKTGMMVKSKSLPTLKAHASSNLFSSQGNLLAKQSQSSSTTQTTVKEQHAPAPTFSSCLAPRTASPDKIVTLTLHLPKSQENHSSSSSNSSLTFCQTSLTVPTYNKVTIKTQSSREQTPSLPKESTKSSTTLQKSSPSSLSPMALFSDLQKETPTLRSDTKLQDKEKEGKGEHGNQEHQEHKQHKQKEEIRISELTSSGGSIQYTYSPMLPDAIIDFALSESQLSSLMHMRVSHLDILRICAEIMKLMLNSREQDSLARLEARKHLIEKAKELVESYENQAKLTQWLGVATATLGIIGAASPLVGEISGDRILEFLQKNMGLFKNASSKTFFKSAGKICSSLSQLTEASSKIYELKETASRTFAENYKEIFRIEHDEITRSIEEVKDHWKNMDNFLLQILQTEHDAIRSLYQ
ncbi:hypothetical protein [Chlamydia gallinacea]|uniref:hypothetical protein n=1 Tax=Chlamydia gallinacea TaxID=1457153 RepID=UPI003C6C70EB